MSSKNQLILKWLRKHFQLKPGKPAYVYGAWILLVLGGPIGVGFILGQLKISAIPTITALTVGMVNKNGTYRQQAIATGTATVGIALALLIANLIDAHLWLAIASTSVIVFSLAFISVWGTTVAGIGLTTSLTYIIFLAKFSNFPDLTTLLQACLLCLAGGLWTMLLSSCLWLIRPYTPAVQAVADCY